MVLGSVDLIAIAFGVFNVLRLTSYWAQIVAVARDCMAPPQSRFPAGPAGWAQTPRQASMPGSI